jgi:hypothetical protein
MSRTVQKQSFLCELSDRRAELPSVHAEFASATLKLRCPNCLEMSNEWNALPRPVNVLLDSMPEGYILFPLANKRIVHVILMRDDLFEALKAHISNALIGDVFTLRRDSSVANSPAEKAPYKSLIVPRKFRIQATRGPYCRHYVCPTCNDASNHIGWARGGVVRSSLDDRVLYATNDMYLAMYNDVYRDLKLQGRFPGLGFTKIDIFDEPQDGECIPGDPGWNGTFTPSPLPDLPKGYH